MTQHEDMIFRAIYIFTGGPNLGPSIVWMMLLNE